MSEEIKEIENTPEKAVYSFGEDKDTLLFSIYRRTGTYLEQMQGDAMLVDYHEIKLNLISSEVSLYEKTSMSARERYGSDSAPNIAECIHELASVLYDDNSKEAQAVKIFLDKIRGNHLVESLNYEIKNTPNRREEEKKRKEKLEEEQRRIELTKKQNEKNATANLNDFLVKKVESNKIETDKELDTGTTISELEKTNVKKDFSEIEVEEAIKNNPNLNKLATLRKKIAHDIDETLGTHLEEKKIAKPIKKIEKAVSDKLFGKVNE